MQRLGRIFYQPYKWLIFIPLMVALTVGFAFIAVVLSIVMSPEAGSRIAGTAWARTLGFITPMTVRVTGRDNIDPSMSYVIVSNHLSHYDIFVLYGWLGLDIKWIMKQELRRIPALGYACQKLGHVFIDRRNRKAAIASVEAAKTRLKGGSSIVFFPEGTRSRTGELGQFKKGAFRMAIDLGWPLLPVSISGTRTILPSGTFDLMPGKATMHIHEPIPIEGFDESLLPELSQRARKAIASGLEEEITS
ncbi:MAG: 1-acyl-sn-glycerol-3-phosphate acyltransferase [bacterium]|nr:1-acyl-sn-glycerol-3-phosphate acyltransferase [bacterium]